MASAYTEWQKAIHPLKTTSLKKPGHLPAKASVQEPEAAEAANIDSSEEETPQGCCFSAFCSSCQDPSLSLVVSSQFEKNQLWVMGGLQSASLWHRSTSS